MRNYVKASPSNLVSDVRAAFTIRITGALQNKAKLLLTSYDNIMIVISRAIASGLAGLVLAGYIFRKWKLQKIEIL